MFILKWVKVICGQLMIPLSRDGIYKGDIKGANLYYFAYKLPDFSIWI